MSRKPPPPVDPPADLSPGSQQLWRHLQPRHCRSVGRQLILRLTLESFDRVTAAKAAIDAEGAIAPATSGKMLHVNPNLRVHHAEQREFLRLWSSLGLSWDDAVDSKIYDGDL